MTTLLTISIILAYIVSVLLSRLIIFQIIRQDNKNIGNPVMIGLAFIPIIGHLVILFMLLEQRFIDWFTPKELRTKKEK